MFSTACVYYPSGISEGRYLRARCPLT